MGHLTTSRCAEGDGEDAIKSVDGMATAINERSGYKEGSGNGGRGRYRPFDFLTSLFSFLVPMGTVQLMGTQ